jgi:PadR family transcriptional regulator, regulatory protein PadR
MKADLSSGRRLTEPEHLVLLAVLRCDDNAYGVSIVDAVEAHAMKTISRAPVYIALRRLESKGYLTSRLADPRLERRA